MVQIPFTKIPSVRMGSIVSTSNIGTGGATPASPIPITYLTQWKIVGNSEVHTLPYPDGVVLPNGYKRCEYLESDGTVYIELPYGFEVTDDIYIKCVMSELVDWGGVIASKTWDTSSNKRFTFGGAVLENSVRVFTSSFGLIGPAGGVLSPQVIADTDIHEWTYANYQITIDNSASKTYSNFGTSGSTDSLRIFYGYDRPRKYRIYDYRHTKGDTEYHLIPCLDSNDTPCMYDVINNQAYYNSAESGSFTYKLYPQPTEIWSCGEYNPIDGKYHILVQPLGGSIADIALTEPLRKVNDVADKIEFPSGTEGKVLVTRNIAIAWWKNMDILYQFINNQQISNYERFYTMSLNEVIGNTSGLNVSICLSANYEQHNAPVSLTKARDFCMCVYDKNVYIRDIDCHSKADFEAKNANNYFFYVLATPTTELVDAPQIEEADSYSMVISQGGKAVEWSSFTTNSE